MAVTELISLDDDESPHMIDLPMGATPKLICFAMRFYMRQPSGRYREVLPYVVRENWPQDWQTMAHKRHQQAEDTK